jgi:hypothetical protein
MCWACSGIFISKNAHRKKASKFEEMNRVKTISFLLAALFFIQASCKKNDNNSITGGGKGGNVTINITPEVYNFLVDTCTVYVKYGTLDAPASGIYDDSAICINTGGKPVATFTNLKVGLYYFYGVGYHTTGGHPPNVKGGMPKTISKEDTYNYYLPTYSYIP